MAKKVLKLRGKPVTLAVPSNMAVLQVNGYDCVWIQRTTNPGMKKQLTDKEYQAIIDHLVQIFPVED